MQGTKPRFSARAANALNCRAHRTLDKMIFYYDVGNGTDGSMQGASSTGESHPAPHSLQHIPGERESDGISILMSSSSYWFQSWFSAKLGVSECPATCHWQFPPLKTWANKKRNCYFKEKIKFPPLGWGVVGHTEEMGILKNTKHFFSFWDSDEIYIWKKYQTNMTDFWEQIFLKVQRTD